MENFIFYFLLPILGIALIGCLIEGIILSIPRLYCAVYERDELNRWKKFIANVDNFYRASTPSPLVSGYYIFNDPEDNVRYEAIIWKDKDGLCSIHDVTGCVCCTFNKYYSKKMAELLLSKND